MGKVDQLLRDIGGNVAESLGVRPNQMPSVVPSSKEVPALPNTGRQRDRDFGLMELDRIACSDQPREDFDDDRLKELAESIKRHGQLSPIRVRWHEDQKIWVVISGERRFRAAKLAGLKTIRCHFIEGDLTEAQILEEQIVENLHRVDLTPVEQAKAYQKLMEINRWRAKELAEHLHIPKSSLSVALALLKLPADIQTQVEERRIPASAAAELSKVNDEDIQRQLASQIVQGKRTRDETKKQVKRHSKRSQLNERRGRTTTEEVFKTPNGIKLTLTANKRTTLDQMEESLSFALDAIRSRRAKDAA
jgi:ParB family chromosome partitioning protein